MSITASGLILPTAAEALVLGDRYQRLVTAIRDVITSNEVHADAFRTTPIVDGQTVSDWRKQSKAEERAKFALWHAHEPIYQERFAELMRVLIEDFDDMTPLKVDPEGTQVRVGQIIYDPEHQFDILDESELRRHEDILVAISVMRILLTKYRVHTRNISRTQHWPIFLERYQSLVMNASHDHRYGDRNIGMRRYA